MIKTQAEEPRKRGRPRKYGQGRASVHVRFTPERAAALKADATAAGRSLSEEVEVLVEKAAAEAASKAQAQFLAELRHLSATRIAQIIEATARRVLAAKRPGQREKAAAE
jgi:hypothetical protein